MENTRSERILWITTVNSCPSHQVSVPGTRARTQSAGKGGETPLSPLTELSLTLWCNRGSIYKGERWRKVVASVAQ
jgi:hypothetical protein